MMASHRQLLLSCFIISSKMMTILVCLMIVIFSEFLNERLFVIFFHSSFIFGNHRYRFHFKISGEKSHWSNMFGMKNRSNDKFVFGKEKKILKYL